MSRRSLRGSLRFIPQNEFLEAPTGYGLLDKLSLAFIFSIRIMRGLSPQSGIGSSFSDLSLARMQIAPV
jgi:hypothetical protein